MAGRGHVRPGGGGDENVLWGCKLCECVPCIEMYETLEICAFYWMKLFSTKKKGFKKTVYQML